jgi:hypothetical protein
VEVGALQANKIDSVAAKQHTDNTAEAGVDRGDERPRAWRHVRQSRAEMNRPGSDSDDSSSLRDTIGASATLSGTDRGTGDRMLVQTMTAPLTRRRPLERRLPRRWIMSVPKRTWSLGIRCLSDLIPAG